MDRIKLCLNIMFDCILSLLRSKYLYLSLTISSISLFVHKLNGKGFAVFSIFIFSTSISISPVGIFGFSIPSGLFLTFPSTDMTHSLPTVSAIS